MNFDDSQLKKRISKLKQLKHEVAPDMLKFFVSVTPKRSGNARSKTRLSNDTIKAEYQYAGELDAGKSKQAPQGMVKPTLAEAKKLVTAWIKKNGK